MTYLSALWLNAWQSYGVAYHNLAVPLLHKPLVYIIICTMVMLSQRLTSTPHTHIVAESPSTVPEFLPPVAAVVGVVIVLLTVCIFATVLYYCLCAHKKGKGKLGVT